MSDSVRPSADISTGLPGGPVACEASDELVRLTATRSTAPPAPTWPTRAPWSPAPSGLTPLKSFCARPSQKLRKLNTALTADGVLRPVVRRTLTPPTWNAVSVGAKAWLSSASPASTSRNVDGTTPWEPTTSSPVIGKSAAVSWPLGPLPANEPPCGLTWLRERLSAPALKWQLAHAVRPSLPACMSQNSALPSWRAAVASLMKRSICGGVGTAMPRRGARPPPRLAEAPCEPPTARMARVATATAASSTLVMTRAVTPARACRQRGCADRARTALTSGGDLQDASGKCLVLGRDLGRFGGLGEPELLPAARAQRVVDLHPLAAARARVLG